MKKESIWKNTAEKPHFEPLKEDIKTDVLITGGGITGLLLAYNLHQKGVDYVLLEKNKICSGVTENTTAKITFGHGLIYNKLIKYFGKEKAKAYYLANKKALEKYKELSNNINCDFQIKSNFVYSKNNKELLFKELEALNSIGCKAEFEANISLPIDNVGAVRIDNQAQFNPLKFLFPISKNLNIYENTKVLEMVDNTAKTEGGVIKADRVVVCTHFPFINKHGFYYLKMHQHRSYVIALEGAGNVNGMYVDENDKGLSFRNYGGLLLLGGGGHRTGQKGGGYNELRHFARINYPYSKERFSFATQDCITLDYAAYIGKYSKGSENLYTATGFNKWGMTSSMVAADILSDMLTDTPNDFAEVFDPSRSILKPKLAVNAFTTVSNLLFPSTKRCPHLGCALKWNKEEHSYDCACHGSRFSEQGKLLNGPATDDIKM